jgi:hypothetical protein
VNAKAVGGTDLAVIFELAMQTSATWHLKDQEMKKKDYFLKQLLES